MKAKLGVSVGLLGAFACFATLFGGYVAAILVVGYCLLLEEDQWLKMTAVKAAVVLVFAGFLSTVVGFIPDFLGWIQSWVSLFKGSFNYSIVSQIVNIITETIYILKAIILIIMGVKALNQQSVSIPFVNKIIEKYM